MGQSPYEKTGEFSRSHRLAREVGSCWYPLHPASSKKGTEEGRANAADAGHSLIVLPGSDTRIFLLW